METAVVASTYDTLLSMNYRGAARVVDYSCTWAESGSVRKVRYWLKYGILNHGDYSRVKLGKFFYHKVNVDELKYAYELLEERAKELGFVINEKIK